MTLRARATAALILSFPLCLSACGDNGDTIDDDEAAGSETGTDNGDGDPTTTGDSNSTAAGDDEGDPSCPIGSEGCPCTDGGDCDSGLTCEAGVCGSNDPSGGDGDGDGDPSTGDGDGEPANACAGDESITIEAEAADEIDGWFEEMSMLGEGVVLRWDNQNEDAFVTWNIDVPCDATWHVWVRAINSGQSDSFFATVDAQPQPPAVFDIDCHNGPPQSNYEWRELNSRELSAPGCEYLEDPWTQDWTAGVHTFTLSYRESYAISKLWITNTDQPPP